MSSLKRHQGCLLIDHSASPGLPPEMARAMGYDPEHCGEGKVFEASTLTCKHCKNAWVMNPLRTRAREYCRLCDHYICDFCHIERCKPDYVHITGEKLAEMAMNAAHRMETLGSPLALVAPSIITIP